MDAQSSLLLSNTRHANGGSELELLATWLATLRSYRAMAPCHATPAEKNRVGSLTLEALKADARARLRPNLNIAVVEGVRLQMERAIRKENEGKDDRDTPANDSSAERGCAG